jgi:hypothetical protein
MRHHLIKPDIPCPNCGQPGLRYVGSWPTGDKSDGDDGGHREGHALLHVARAGRR